MALSNLKQKLVSFVFRPVCCFCDQETGNGLGNDRQGDKNCRSIVCHDCYEEIVGITIDRCYFCGAEIFTENPFGSRCRGCRDWKSRFERVFSIGNYRAQLKRTILEIKRDCNDVKAHQLGSFLGSLADKFDLPGNIDCVIPVPSHWRRRLSRKGFHVSDVIAEGFCQFTGMDKSKRALKCVRFTKKQAKLRPKQRMKNVRGAFAADSRFQLQGMRVLLIDDVITSGATSSECTRVLLAAGAEAVFVAATARAAGVS